ncbi:hypothetical protein ACFC26_15955 [Kitasatospora purpeofusca]|uniref:hypothetical protein n=1 Tax=Kitasatospora purpeofusca TaxID=67352 RepID=UPI0035D59AAE
MTTTVIQESLLGDTSIEIQTAPVAEVVDDEPLRQIPVLPGQLALPFEDGEL